MAIPKFKTQISLSLSNIYGIRARCSNIFFKKKNQCRSYNYLVPQHCLAQLVETKLQISATNHLQSLIMANENNQIIIPNVEEPTKTPHYDHNS